MNLDKLISKYLDGELSRSEDNELRRLLSEDIKAKETFDAYVLIHAAMKEDAKTIAPSEELVSKTEDMILTKILAEQPIVGDTLPEKKRRKTLVYFSVVALLLFLSVISISEFSYMFSTDDIAQVLERDRTNILHLSNLEQIGISNELISEPEMLTMRMPADNSNSDMSVVAATAVNTNNTHNVINTIGGIGGSGGAVAKRKVNVLVLGSENSSIQLKDSFVENLPVENQGTNSFAYNSTEDESSVLLLDDEAISNSDLLPVANLYSASEQQQVYTNPMEYANTTINTVENKSNVFGEQNENYFYGKRSDIQLTTFFGSPVFQGGFNDNTPDVLANFSQSVAYNVSDEQQFGIDIGFTKYSFDQTRIVRVPGIINSEPDYIVSNGVEIRETGPSGNYIEAPITVNTQYQTIWGAGFFDQRILHSNKFTLNGRIGLGGTNDGPLGYVRFYAKYNILRWLSINAGADGRMFRWSESAFGANSSEFKSTISIIYGFEIKI